MQTSFTMSIKETFISQRDHSEKLYVRTYIFNLQFFFSWTNFAVTKLSV